jgi:hypothetical protein
MRNDIIRTVPRLLRQHENELTKQWMLACPSTTTSTTSKTGWSPHDILKYWCPSSTSLTVKQSSSRFFMYEEHSNSSSHNNTADKGSQLIINQHSPNDLADILCDTSRTDYHYWTSPISEVAPSLLKERLQGYESLHSISSNSNDIVSSKTKSTAQHDNDKHSPLPPPTLDPRGPSLWMGSSGSATQAHYDVADNIIVQLHGHKRVRLYPPSAACALHVFPDAHPKARKSQVDFDDPDVMGSFPFFADVVGEDDPFLDVVLQPGDSLRIPAFWFHHLENGRRSKCGGHGDGDGHGDGEFMERHDGPSVSLNLFALSAPMQTAQNIFRDGRAPFPSLLNLQHQRDIMTSEDRFNVAAVALRMLGWALLEGIDIGSCGGSVSVSDSGVKECPGKVIQRVLLDSRYAPLGPAAPFTVSVPASGRGRNRRDRSRNRRDSGDHTHGGSSSSSNNINSSSIGQMTVPEMEMLVETCVSRLLPQFESLRAAHNPCETQGISHDGGADGVVLLVACHLLELWAVELVGASAVGSVWERALSQE